MKILTTIQVMIGKWKLHFSPFILISPGSRPKKYIFVKIHKIRPKHIKKIPSKINNFGKFPNCGKLFFTFFN